MSKRPNKRSPVALVAHHPPQERTRRRDWPRAAHDADEAIKIAIEQYEVAPAFRGRLMA
jgi:hypothetical protein